MITARQSELLYLIDFYLKRDGKVPAYRVLMEELGLKHKSGINQLLGHLIGRGFIQKRGHKFKVLKLPGKRYRFEKWDLDEDSGEYLRTEIN